MKKNNVKKFAHELTAFVIDITFYQEELEKFYSE